MNNKNNPRKVILICLFICIAITSTTITVKTFLRLDLLPAASRVLIESKIEKTSEMTDSKLLKENIVSELRNYERLSHERQEYFKFILLSGILILLISVFGLFLLFRQ